MELGKYSDKCERLQIRCTPQQKDVIEMAAAKAGLSVSEYVLRTATSGYMDFQTAQMARTVREVLAEFDTYLERMRITF